MSVALVVAAGATFLSACDSQSPTKQSLTGEQTSDAAPPVTFTSSIADKATDVRPDAVITVSAKGGDLHGVVLTGPKKETLQGEVTGGVWRLRDMLSPGQAYSLSITGANADGKLTKVVRTFTTLKPEVEATYRVTPDKETVGVGMPVLVSFDSAVKTQEMRAAIEKKLVIKTVPQTAGSWGWVSDNEVAWRPVTYWKPNTKVTVNAPLRGMQTGRGKWVTQDKGATFTISSRARISTVDLASHEMTVRENGRVVATYPISGGKPYGTYETRSGTKVITEKKRFMVMDAASLGVPKDDPNYYRTEVNYAMRVTNTGEFLHSAPWSVWAQGRRNVSHGCVNLGPGAARKMFRDSIVGDVVDFKGSDRIMKPGDGLSVWLFSPAEWRAKSALAPKPVAKDRPSAKRGSQPSATTSPATLTEPRV